MCHGPQYEMRLFSNYPKLEHDQMEQTPQDVNRQQTVNVVSAYVSHNSIPAEDVTQFIQRVYDTISQLGVEPAKPEMPKPAVPIKQSVTDDYLICLEDGAKLKMLKRHLKTAFNMTPEEYRQRWGLKPDYPMVAPSYARQRSELAKQIGLGSTGRRRNR